MNGIIIKGYADAIARNIVWDYKTGKRNPFKEIEYFYQLNIYRLTIAKSRGIDPENIEAKIIWISRDCIDVQNVEWDDKILEKIEILKNNFTDIEKSASVTINKEYCNFCPMKKYCDV